MEKANGTPRKKVQRLNELGKQCYTIRCGNIYGYSPSMRFDSVINRFVFEANFTRRISINGTGAQYRSFVHVDRAAEILSKIPFSSISPGCYNLVEHSSNVNEIADALNANFPDLEQIYVNQHLELDQLRVKSNPALDALASSTQPVDLTQRLADFAMRFTF